MSYQEPFVKVIDTNATKKPDMAQFIVKNPLKKDIFVNSIQLSFDAYFSEKGIVVIKINGNIILNEKPAGSYSRIQNFPVPLKNQELFNQNKIEIFVWNGIDDDFVSCGVDIQISEHEEMGISSDTPLSQTLRNQQISDSFVLFPEILRLNQTDTALIDMKGNKKLRVFLSGASYVPPTLVRPVGATNVVDGDLNTFYNVGENLSAYEHSVVDFGNSIERTVKAKVQKGSGTGTSNLQGSNDGVNWSGNLASIGIGTMQATATYRFWRVWISGGNFGGGDQWVFEIYDGNIFGATSSLSFEALNVATNQWQEIIASSEFGTVSQGSAIVKEIGDVNTISVSGKTYALPSTQNKFRAKLTTIGGITIGVSATRIA